MVTKVKIIKNEAKTANTALKKSAAGKKLEESTPVFVHTPMNNILHSISSSADMYIKKRKFNISIGPYAHKSYLSNTFIRSSSEQTHFGFEKFSNTLNLLKTFYALTCVNTFFTGRMELLGRADGFMFYVILKTDFFCNCTYQSETTNQATHFRNRSKFRLTIDNFNSIHGIVNYWFNIRRNDPEDD